ncbi:FecR family protein [Novosphingobium lentum]|uniref:FecR family protein n=1 Tax=Novosphingobium lentum TaxID=145287 RepID=UPI0008314AFE|nr:FecR domain-containing protein [Novosphingobium lentum]
MNTDPGTSTSSMRDIVETAAQWHVASACDDMDWDGFTAWLEADPAHARAYDEIALADGLIDEHRPALLETEEAAFVAPSRTRVRLALAVAAVLAVAISLPALLVGKETVYRTEAAGRHIALEDGSAIDLAPHSQLSISGRRHDRMALSGGAYFAIQHDPARQLLITAGPIGLRDIGTRFDVQRDGTSVRVAVSEGRLTASSDGLDEPIALDAGKALRIDGETALGFVTPVRPETVGEWRAGHLSYQNAPLALVAGDLARYAGVQIAVPVSLRSRTFSGTLALGDGRTAAHDLAQLLGLALRDDRGGFVMEPAGR